MGKMNTALNIWVFFLLVVSLSFAIVSASEYSDTSITGIVGLPVNNQYNIIFNNLANTVAFVAIGSGFLVLTGKD
jgi:hypothetical protein